ncbi:MAG: orotidine 5'-phosphate decarboxylase [Candidatus Doudnabacteria bacterium]|nr:orotidine 5'-phosphate decarboxylase [Candidatus Doudnabacteria bacterium]
MRDIRDILILDLKGLTNDQALAIARLLGHLVYAVKIHDGPLSFVLDLLRTDVPRVMKDRKIHETPSGAAYVADQMVGAQILTAHCSGGHEMLRQVKDAFRSGEVYGVTLLSSFSDDDVRRIYGCSFEEQIKRLATEAVRAGITGVVCPVRANKILSEWEPTSSLKLMNAGTRLPGEESQGHFNAMSPAYAILSNASHLVVGRQVVQAEEPRAALERYLENIRTVLPKTQP